MYENLNKLKEEHLLPKIDFTPPVWYQKVKQNEKILGSSCIRALINPDLNVAPAELGGISGSRCAMRY